MGRVMTCRVLALKRDVCRVPCHDGQLLASMSLWVPMFFDLLPPTSLATLQQALPHGMQRSRAWCGTPPILGVVNMVGTRNFTCYMGAL